MKISSYSFPAAPAWQRLGARTAADSSVAEAREAESSADSQRLRDMREALARLKVSPAAPKSNREEAISKASWLKQRLEELKAMLMYATPEQARALARELKDIASQLGAVARSASGGGSSQSAVAGVVEAVNGAAAPDAAGAASAGSEAAASEAGAAEASATAAVSSATQANAAAGEAKAGTDASTGAAGRATADATAGKENGEKKSTSAQGSDDSKTLRQILEEARKLLKQAINMLKSKLSHADPEAQGDLQAAEKSLASMDAAMASGSEDIGSTISAAVNAAIGANIDVTA